MSAPLISLTRVTKSIKQTTKETIVSNCGRSKMVSNKAEISADEDMKISQSNEYDVILKFPIVVAPISVIMKSAVDMKTTGHGLLTNIAGRRHPEDVSISKLYAEERIINELANLNTCMIPWSPYEYCLFGGVCDTKSPKRTTTSEHALYIERTEDETNAVDPLFRP